MLLFLLQNAGQNWDIKIVSRSFENVSQFKYLGTTLTNENLIDGEIKRRLNLGNACYHSVQNENMQDCNVTCGSVWAWNLVSDVKGGT
jgi:hypothetical protein